MPQYQFIKRQWPVCATGITGLIMAGWIAASLAESFNAFMVRGGSDARDQQCACQQILVWIHQHKQQWALDNHLGGDAEPAWDDLVTSPGCFEYFSAQPVCPSGGTYTIGIVDDPPACSFQDAPNPHTLPEFPHLACYPLPRDVQCYCQNNLVKIDTAKRQWAISHQAPVDAVPEWSDLLTSGSGSLRAMPICPFDGIYAINAVRHDPSCSFQDGPNPHVFPQYPGLPCYPDDIDRLAYCAENLRKIDSAKQQWALDFNQPGIAYPTWYELIPPNSLGYLPRILYCPSDGSYTINQMDTDPTCTVIEPYHHNIYYLPYWDKPVNDRLGRSICLHNLSEIHMAKQQWALDYNLPPDAVPDWNDLVQVYHNAGYLPHILNCPKNGEYSLNAVSELPICSYQDPCPHVLP